MVPRLPIVDQKQQRVDNFERCLSGLGETFGPKEKILFHAVCNNRQNIDPPLHYRNKSAVSLMEAVQSEEKNANIN